MNGCLPITLTPQQQAACNGRKWKGLTQTEQMGVLITIFAQLAGMPISCETLQAYAAQYACLPRNDQLPALIWLASQIVGGGVGNIFDYSSGGTGAPPPIIPQPVATAYAGVTTGFIANDTSTGQQWNWNPATNAWQ